MNKHNEKMLQALEASFYQLGITSPNPPVGALIVKNDEVLAQGVTQQCGSDHAEICALHAAGSVAEGADLYVTLEPCCHYGKTPPCTESIIRSGIKRVYIASLDPNPQVAGKGVYQLRSAGIEVIMLPDMESYAKQIMLPFFTYITQKRPHILHKAAFSIDGRIATKKGDSKWISSLLSRYIVHKLRSLVDGIIIGKNTFMYDNPTLSVRFDEFDDLNTLCNFSHEPMYIGSDNLFLKLLHTYQPKLSSPCRQPCRILLGLPDMLDLQANFFL
jgi:diaminohydroxyphosphoribosylaminopyrimidine deaminase/5-amino-6-(5-phosphoribosylamino)uracil reductase